MGLKLLPKSDIAKAKALDREKEVQEGLKLARRVDALRETAANEETALESFRVKTLTEIQLEILEATNKRDTLITEVKSLEERKKEALVPLESEWKAVIQEKGQLEAKEEQLEEVSDRLDARTKALNGRERDIIAQENRANDMHKRATVLLDEADTLKSDTVLKNQQATEMLEKAQIRSRALYEKVEVKEKELANRELVVAQKDKEFIVKELELAGREKALRDKQETLLRTINRKK